MSLSEAQIRRYARQIVLPEIGGVGQAKLLSSSVLVIGAGGLGSPLALYLAAAGVGRIGIVDHDVVEETNLQRQIAYAAADRGRLKVDAMADRLHSLEAGGEIITHDERLCADNAERLVGAYDIIADGCDDLDTRLLVHDVAMKLGKPLVSGAVQGLDGQITTYKAYLGDPHPCMRCFMGDTPSADGLPTCAQGGILGSAAGVVGSLQATEVIKECLGLPGLSGRLLFYDAALADMTSMRLPRRAECRSACVAAGRDGCCGE